MNLSFFKICCKITAVGNLIAAVVAIASMPTHLAMFYTEPTVTPVVEFYHYGFWFIVMLLGAAYWELAKDPFRLRIIAFIGGAGKLVLVALWTLMLFKGGAKPMVLAGIIYDGFFGVVLAWFYIWSRGRSEAT